MHSRHGSLLACVTLMALACDGSQPAAPELLASAAGGATAVLTGSGHHSRIVTGTETDLTTFAFTAVLHADGSVSGHYEYNFRARGFAIQGTVTCVSTNGTQAWVGGTVDHVITDDPGFEELLGLEMWWRSIDGGEGESAADLTSGVGFELAGNPTTAASWCAGQPPVLPLRPVERGNIQLRN